MTLFNFGIFFWALFFSLVYVAKLVEFHVRGINKQKASIGWFNLIMPSLLWTLYFFL